jgi:uncharacterized protein YdbL (DUF1318 family)
LEVNTPAIAALTQSMQARFAQMLPHFAGGAVGFTRDGNVAVRDMNLVPVPQRQAITTLVAQENQDRAALYRAIAQANNKPEWEGDIRNTFAQRWVQKALAAGWFYQNPGGQWVKK